jgi:hypothetical protein
MKEYAGSDVLLWQLKDRGNTGMWHLKVRLILIRAL